MEKENQKKVSMEEIVSLCKRRGFVFQGSEIYGGLAGTYDYGHYGTLLKENIKNAWIKSVSQERDDVYLLDSAIFMHPTTWKASGHVDNFDDPLVDCKKCQSRIRADHLLESFGINADKQSLDFVNAEMDKLRTEKKLVCPTCGSADLTAARSFSLMVKSNFGSPVDTITDENVVYLRPETCGGIYLQYKNTLDSMHPKLPFGIAQVGKAFRNEIVTKQYIFRTREFEQMEMQYFFNPKALGGNAATEYFKAWQEYRWKWYLDHGIDVTRLRWYKHEKLAHYASDAYDIEYNFKSMDSYKEIEGVHQRGDWDLSQHSKFSGENLTYFEEETKERFTPHIMETSTGLARQMLMFIDNAYQTDIQNGEERVFLKFHRDIAPIKIAVLPLMKNKTELTDKAKTIYNTLRKNFRSEYDDSGSIGKRYRRQDEIGTPFCVTVDYTTLEDNTVTIRDRDTAEQRRINIDELENYIK